jgi:hypothetical protein
LRKTLEEIGLNVATYSNSQAVLEKEINRLNVSKSREQLLKIAATDEKKIIDSNLADARREYINVAKEVTKKVVFQ